MTPTCTRLKMRLDDRTRWFINEWFFKWHFIGCDGPVSIAAFDGSEMHMGGIMFSGSARDVYWDTIVRGVKQEIVEQFAWVEQEVHRYSRETALQAIDECAGLLASFVRTIRRQAVAKDRILRGDGINFPAANDAGWWDGTSDKDITDQADALKKALPLAIESQPPPTTLAAPLTARQLALAIWNDNQWWLGPIAFLVGLAGVYPLIF